MKHLIPIFTLVLLASFPAYAQEPPTENPTQQIVHDALKKKTVMSGTLDIYDDAIQGVRNLRLMSVEPVELDGPEAVVPAEFRDVNSGEIVEVNLKMTRAGDAWLIGASEIEGVAKAPTQIDENKTYTDAEILDAMKSYVDKKSAVTGTFMLFDENKKAMRNLTFQSLDDSLRKFGVLSISTAEFVDQQTGEEVLVDLTVKNDKGRLNVDRLKIKSVKQPN